MVCGYEPPALYGIKAPPGILGGKFFGVWVAAGPDGRHFQLLGKKPAYRNSDTGNIAFWDDRINRYVHFVRNWFPDQAGMRKVGRVESDDVTDFGGIPTQGLKPGEQETTVFGHDDDDPADMDFYTNACIKYPFAEDAYFIFPSAYFHYPDPPVGERSNDGPLDIRLAVSRNGVDWNRVSRKPFVPLGVQGSFDDSVMYMVTGLLRKGAELLMYYHSFDFTHGAHVVNKDKQKGVISRVVLRLDGFVSADADYGGGRLVTPPITFSGSRLQLNVETSVAGRAQVEIRDADEAPIPGFTLQECDPIQLNWIDKTVTWNGSSDLSALADRPIRLHIAMRDAKLYAFQFVK